MFTICLPSYVLSQGLPREQDESARYKSWIHKYYIDTHSFSSLIRNLSTYARKISRLQTGEEINQSTNYSFRIFAVWKCL